MISITTTVHVGLVQVPLAVNLWKSTPPDAPHFIPVASPLSTVRTKLLVPPIANMLGTPEPSPAIKCPLVAIVAVTAMALVLLPTRIPLAVRLVPPVPPFATGNVPLTPVAKATSFQAGMLLVPVLARYWVEVVDLANRAGVLAPLA
jgi:hypothetical protein